MLYRDFTRDKLKISSLGLGCMRFPLLDPEDSSSIDEDKAFEIVKYAYSRGVNYFDTAYIYHGDKSEDFMGRALERLGREKIYLATKSPLWMVNSYGDIETYFETQLDRLRTDYIDFYLAHGVNKDRYERMKKYDYMAFLDKEKAKGRIKYAGFSFHDDLETFKATIDLYDWDFCQIQLNYMDTDYQAGLEGLRYAKEKGLSLVIMEPVKGGRLAIDSREFKDIFQESARDYTPPQWALKWLYDHEEISVVLSGMGSLDQVRENTEVASREGAGNMTGEDRAIISRARAYLESKIKVDCTACQYCMPCPLGVKIPQIFQYYNDSSIYGDQIREAINYRDKVGDEGSQPNCIACGKCESICPQELPIIKKLGEAHDYFSSIL